MSAEPIFGTLSRTTFDTPSPSPYADGLKKGLSEELVRQISADKNEPEWMLHHRLDSLKIFYEKELPTWGADLSPLDLDDIIYYARPGTENNKFARSTIAWEFLRRNAKCLLV